MAQQMTISEVSEFKLINPLILHVSDFPGHTQGALMPMVVEDVVLEAGGGPTSRRGGPSSRYSYETGQRRHSECLGRPNVHVLLLASLPEPHARKRRGESKARSLRSLSQGKL